MKRDRLKEDLLVLLQAAKGRRVLSIEEILSILEGKGRLILLILLSFPFCLPIHIPGFSTPFGLVIAFIGLRMAFSKRVWLPNALLDKNIPGRTVREIARKILHFVEKLRVFIRPRLGWIFRYRGQTVLNGLLIFVLAVLLALPLPIPFTNLSVALPVFLISIGLLERDGLTLLIGYVLSLFGILFFFFLALPFLTIDLVSVSKLDPACRDEVVFDSGPLPRVGGNHDFLRVSIQPSGPPRKCGIIGNDLVVAEGHEIEIDVRGIALDESHFFAEF
jgi:hypothetical protein